MMGSSASGGDPLTGMIAMLTDPKAFTAKMIELKEAKEANDKSLVDLRKAEGEAAERDRRATEREAILDRRAAEIAAANADISKRASELDARAKTLDHVKSQIDQDRRDIRKQADAIAEATAKEQERVRQQQAALDTRMTDIKSAEAELDKRAATIAVRSADLDGLISEYESKLAALKAIVG